MTIFILNKRDGPEPLIDDDYLQLGANILRRPVKPFSERLHSPDHPGKCIYHRCYYSVCLSVCFADGFKGRLNTSTLV